MRSAQIKGIAKCPTGDDEYSASGTSDGETVTVAASGEVVSLLPFFGTITVKAQATAKVESFDPQGAPLQRWTSDRRGMMTRRGGTWQVSNVLGLVRRTIFPPTD